MNLIKCLGFHSFLLLFSLTAICQTKTYNGKYDGIVDRSGLGKEIGVANYEYYENGNYDRILNGGFKFHGDKWIIDGRYSNNLKHGYWKILSRNSTDFISFLSSGDCKVILNIEIFGSFNLGEFENEWHFSYNSSSMKCSSLWSKKTVVESIANFHNGLFVGRYRKETFIDNISEITVGQFNSQGFLDGIWVTTKESVKTITKFKNGFCYFKLQQNITTGEKLDYFDETEWSDKFWKNFDTITHISVVDDICYKIDTVKGNFPIWAKDKIYVEDDVFPILNPIYNTKGTNYPKSFILTAKKCDEETENKD